MKILVYDPKKDKLVLTGNVIDKKFYRNVEQRHFMRIMNGYGIQEEAYKKCIDLGVKEIVLKELQNNRLLTSKMSDWLEHGIVRDFGSGEQRFLSIKFMTNGS